MEKKLKQSTGTSLVFTCRVGDVLDDMLRRTSEVWSFSSMGDRGESCDLLRTSEIVSGWLKRA